METSPEDSIITSLKVPVSSEQMESLLHLQQEIMAKIAVGSEHQKILDDLCRAAEAMLPNSVASIMLFDEKREGLFVRAAPNVPAEAVDALNGLIPSQEAGSCGTAVFKNSPQFVCDTQNDNRWAAVAFQEFVEKFKIYACWSMPIRDSGSFSLGSFALSSMERRQPHAFHQKLLETCAGIVAIVLKREKEEQELWKMAHYDDLTGLPNRVLFNFRLEHAIEKSKRAGRKIAVLFMDLDDFKNINDTLGHKAGDLALKEVASRVCSCIREEDTFSRMGGDEFILMIEEVDDQIDASHVAAKILQALELPLVLGGQERRLSASIGISLYPEDGLGADSLLQNADTAMFEAKKRGRNGFFYYESALTEVVEERVGLENELRQAIQLDQLVVHYQPQFDAQTLELVGVEALVRWLHPAKGLIPPNKFIPVAEDLGVIEELGQVIMEKACAQCVRWWGEGFQEFTLSLNISVKQLQEGCAEKVELLANELNFPVDQLEMEVTESLIMARGDGAISELEKMKASGISIAMDDFGTGHSSLAQIKKLPISKLKIDRSFVRDTPEDESDVVIVKTIIAMAKTLGLKVVAEGVETEEQKALLINEGCDDLQGYLLGRPVDAAVFEKQLESIRG